MAAKTTRRSSGTIHFAPEVTFAGNTATISSTDLSIGDSLLTLNKGNSSLPSTSGIEIEEAGSIISSLKYTESSGNGTWAFLGKGTSKINFNNASFENFALGVISTADINGGTIDGATIGATSHSTGKFTDLTATGTVNLGSGSVTATTFTGALTGAVNGNVTGNLVGNTTGNVTGNLIGDVYASDTTTKILEAGTNGSDATIQATLTGNSTGIHTGNVRKGDGTVIVDVAASPASFTGQVSSIANHNTGNLTEGSNLYYTDARVLTKINATSINSLSDVNTSGITTDDYLKWNGSHFVPAQLGYAVAKWKKTSSASTTGATGTALRDEASASLSTVINILVANTPVRVNSQVRFTGSSTGSTDIYVRLYRDSTIIAEFTAEDCTSTARTFTASFDLIDDQTTLGNNTYAIKYAASDANGTLTPNPAFSTGTGQAKNYVQVTEIYPDVGLLKNVVEDTNPKLGGQLNADNKKIINLATPVANTDAANKQYVDDQVATENTIAEMNDVDTTGIGNNKILKYNSTSSKWEMADDNYEDGIVNVVEDATPQLGGDLDLNSNNITGTGVINITGGVTASTTGAFKDGTYSGNVTIEGNLTVNGDTTTVDVQTLEVEDPIIIMNKHQTQPANNNTDAGLIVQRGSDASEKNAAWFWDEASDRWIAATTTNDGTASVTNITVTAKADIEADTVHATATTAQYADLAENYTADAEYQPGTIVVHGGSAEVTQSTTKMDHKVAGVVSTNPAYLMNSEEKGITVPVALRGKVPVSVMGPVAKGDLIVTSDTPGVGEAHPGVTNCVFVVGKSLEDDDTENLVRLINVLV